jgi:hypothetical protein
MSLVSKRTLKGVLGELPLTAEVYWRLLQQGQPLSKSFSLRRVEEKLPAWRAEAQKFRQQAAGRGKAAGGKRIFIFSTLLYWIEHTTLLGLSMSGLGHDVTLAYLPYANWRTPFNRFDLRRQNAYAKGILSQTAPLIDSLSLLDVKTGADGLPALLAERIREVSLRDAQYTLQVEDVDQSNTSNSESARLYRLRVARNTQAASAALTWMQANHPEVVIVPNGSILEMGAVYQAAHYLEIPVVTYEFGEQRQRIWLAQNAEVMRQDTQALWQARQDLPLQEAQWDQIRTLFASRQRASLWENFSRRWQGLPSQGGDKVRAELGLDRRPLVLLAANVIGDSLTLGRQVFSDSMTEWLTKTVQYFAGQPQAQLVIRIHPGERYTQGPSVADVVRQALPDVDSLSHIHLVEAQAPVNTYDLVEIADLGLVYTTTVGMEMAMSAVPVIVVGQTHYRGKGFTLDPQSWQAYFDMLQQVLAEPARVRPSREQVERAWNYAYRFFFEYPNPFPWHLLHFWNELERWPLERVLSQEGQQEFGQAFRYLAGEARQWTNIA